MIKNHMGLHVRKVMMWELWFSFGKIRSVRFLFIGIILALGFVFPIFKKKSHRFLDWAAMGKYL